MFEKIVQIPFLRLREGRRFLVSVIGITYMPDARSGCSFAVRIGVRVFNSRLLGQDSIGEDFMRVFSEFSE